MKDIAYLDRISKRVEAERVYGGTFLDLLYGQGWKSKIFSPILKHISAKWRWSSAFYGWLQKSSWSRFKIAPFVKKFGVDREEFLEPIESYRSFNEFFIRKLKPSARPLAQGNDIAIMPADGRCLVFDNIEKSDGFIIKGVKFSLREFILDDTLYERYKQGSMAILRLCPSDYHRFHFPFNCLPSAPKQVDGTLYSVNPVALKQDIEILTKNKREITTLQTKSFGQVLYIEVGATYVGTIHQTFIPNEPYAKGDEKGYFSFGGSCLVLLFEHGRIQFDQDLLEASQKNMETRCLLGQTLGRSFTPF